MAETPDWIQIFETLNQCQQPPISRSLVMQDTVSQVFYYLKLQAFLIILKDRGHTLDSNLLIWISSWFFSSNLQFQNVSNHNNSLPTDQNVIGCGKNVMKNLGRWRLKKTRVYSWSGLAQTSTWPPLAVWSHPKNWMSHLPHRVFVRITCDICKLFTPVPGRWRWL